MKTVEDFNYKVALAEGLRSLRVGRLGPAEEHFRYLVSKFPRADGGYRGLAKVQVEQGDRRSAVSTLRDGAAALARSGERSIAIGLLREAVDLDPLDLSAHRRLAAALALAGETSAAADEHVRFIEAEVREGDPERARLEVRYALETVGDVARLRELADSLGAPPPRERPEPAGSASTEPEPAAAADPRLAALGMAAPAAPPPAPAPPRPVAAGGPALPAAIAEARAHLAAGRLQAASDILLEQVHRGGATHQAQEALIEVNVAMGRPDIARAKAKLLADALRLAGEERRADEVERRGRSL